MGKVRVWLAFREREPGIIEDEVVVDAVKDMFRDLAGITLKRANAKKLGLRGDQLVLSAVVTPDKYIKVLSAFHELLLSSLLRSRYRRSWTMVMTSRPVGSRKDRAKKNVVPIWYLFELKNGLFLDTELEKSLVTNSIFKITWSHCGQIFQQTLLALYVPWQWAHDNSDDEEEESAPTDPVPLSPPRPAPVPRQPPKEPAFDWYEERAPPTPASSPTPSPVPKAATRPAVYASARQTADDWIKSMDSTYNPSARDKTGPKSLGGPRFLLSQALHRNGFYRGGDMAPYCSAIPEPKDVGLAKCTDAMDLPVEMERSEVSAEGVRSNGMGVEFDVANRCPKPVTVRIPQGLAFEVDTPELGVQCLVSRCPMEFTLQPGERRPVKVECYCANQHFSGPGVADMTITPYRTTVPLGSQDAVWEHFK